MGTDLELLRAKDVAPMLGVGVRRVLQLARAGRVPAVREGRGVRFPRAALQLWLAGRTALALASLEPQPDPGSHAANESEPNCPVLPVEPCSHRAKPD